MISLIYLVKAFAIICLFAYLYEGPQTNDKEAFSGDQRGKVIKSKDSLFDVYRDMSFLTHSIIYVIW